MRTLKLSRCDLSHLDLYDEPLDPISFLRKIVNMNKIKFNILDEIIPPYMKNTTINICINLNTILNYLYTEKNIAAYNALNTVVSNTAISVELVNLFIHYREFFFKRRNCSTRIFVYYFNKEVSKSFDGYFKDELETISEDNPKSAVMNQLINLNLKLVNEILYYIDDMYFIKSDGIEPSLIPYYILKKLNNKSDKTYNLVLSRDKFDRQMLLLERTCLLNLNGKKTKLLKYRDIYDNIHKRNVHPLFYPILLSFNGLNNRNIDRIEKFSFKKVAKQIETLNELGLDVKPNIRKICRLIECDNYDKVLDNYYTCDLERMYNNISNLEKQIITGNLINRHDNQSLMALNNSVIYMNNNIKLVEAFMGV